MSSDDRKCCIADHIMSDALYKVCLPTSTETRKNGISTWVIVVRFYDSIVVRWEFTIAQLELQMTCWEFLLRVTSRVRILSTYIATYLYF